MFNVCTYTDRAGCDFMGRSCESCSKKRNLEIHPYVAFLLWTRNLFERGYPLHRDSLYLETWTDLIRLESTIVQVMNKKRKDK